MTSPRTAGLAARTPSASSSSNSRTAASGWAAASAMRANSDPWRATVTEPSGRKPTAGEWTASCSHSSRARTARSSSGPWARPLTQTRPKLRTDARRGPASASRWVTSQPRRQASRACMVPRTPPPTMTTRCASTGTIVVTARGAAGRRRWRTVEPGPDGASGSPSWLPSRDPPGRLNWPLAHSGVAQLAARVILVHEVGGSSPPPRAHAVALEGAGVADCSLGVIECSTEVPGRPRAARQGPIV